MSAIKRITDLKNYKSVLPYASEIFGVYQPLIGWKGKRNIQRFILKPIYVKFPQETITQIGKRLTERVEYKTKDYQQYLKEKHDPDVGKKSNIKYITEDLTILPAESGNISSNLFIDSLRETVKDESYSEVTLEKYFTQNYFSKLLKEISKKLLLIYVEEIKTDPLNAENNLQISAKQASLTAGGLLELKNKKAYDSIGKILSSANYQSLPITQFEKQYIKNPFESFDPTRQLDQVGLSPIGIVHLFRQYFFELDTFLGTPVGHVWLSPGSTVELIESSTRRKLIEQTVEYEIETILKNESSVTDKDELSEAVKSENENEIKFGVNVSGGQNWVWGEASQSASFDIGTTQKNARENTHSRAREQSTKLTSEIRKNYKSTFKTVTETTDLSSKRMVLTNNTESLINYELRRKMRQVVVQVQDIGTYLCWQTFVDRPGDALGLSNLVHIAQKPEGPQPQPPEELPEMLPYSSPPSPLTIECIGANDDFDDNALDEFYVRDPENSNVLKEDNGDEYKILRYLKKKVNPEKPGYTLKEVRLMGNADVVAETQIDNPQTGEFTIILESIQFRDKTSIAIQAIFDWEVDTTSQYYLKRLEDHEAIKLSYDEMQKEIFKNQFITAARERIKLASKIVPRDFQELREEERIVVYRSLISALGKEVVYKSDEANPNVKKVASDSDFHVFYELLNSIFDINKMLYFVAPEWWKAKPITQLQMGSATIQTDDKGQNKVVSETKTVIPKEHFVSWDPLRLNNYLITEESSPAKMGSSLGWLLQLDGDNLRNTFLNSPWVKAVIPIRPGKEIEALNWLKQVEEMNGIGENDMYQGPEPEHQGKTLLQVLEILAQQVKKKHEKGFQVSTYNEEDEGGETIDDRNIVNATPVDKVYEHGFYPLQGGFRANVDEEFQIFDQWVEILPTDQTVPVEVTYDPLTGRQN